jgi:NAD-dependent dihydropyrimidine dehydrogenase PreA subunit
MPYVITEPCTDVLDKSCVDECPVDCIYEGDRLMVIHPDECVDCGACVPVCPQDAVFFADEVPIDWAGYIDASTRFFATIGSPGGAARLRRTVAGAAEVQSPTN